MSKKVSPVPRGYRTATTCLTVVDVDAAIAFYQAAFGAEVLTRQTAVDSEFAVHATIKIGNSIIAVNQEAPELGLLSPWRLGASVSQVHLYVEDVDASWERAVEAGAMVFTPVYDAYWGDRTGVLADGNGYLWSVATRVENVSQDEIAERARAAAEAPIEVPAEAVYQDWAAEVAVPEQTVVA